MLFGQQRCRAKNCDLFSTHDSHKRGAKSNFGLTKANVAADQTVHRFVRDHVAVNGVNSGELVFRFFKSEGFGERFVISQTEFESVALAGLTQGINIQEFCCCIAYLKGGFLACFFPIALAQGVQRSGFWIGAGIARDQMQLSNGNIKFGVFGVVNLQEFCFSVRRAH